jgi:hypothetical protein
MARLPHIDRLEASIDMVLAEGPILLKAADHWRPAVRDEETGMRAEGWAEMYEWRVDRAAAMPLFHQIYQQAQREHPGADPDA